jgi:hypothetical protein
MNTPCNSCERLEMALEFYADKKHVAEDQWFEGEAGHKDICTEKGEIARKALSEHRTTSQQPSPQTVSGDAPPVMITLEKSRVDHLISLEESVPLYKDEISLANRRINSLLDRLCKVDEEAKKERQLHCAGGPG